LIVNHFIQFFLVHYIIFQYIYNLTFLILETVQRSFRGFLINLQTERE
jgi:hypothetical protein